MRSWSFGNEVRLSGNNSRDASARAHTSWTEMATATATGVPPSAASAPPPSQRHGGQARTKFAVQVRSRRAAAPSPCTPANVHGNHRPSRGGIMAGRLSLGALSRERLDHGRSASGNTYPV